MQKNYNFIYIGKHQVIIKREQEILILKKDAEFEECEKRKMLAVEKRAENRKII